MSGGGGAPSLGSNEQLSSPSDSAASASSTTSDNGSTVNLPPQNSGNMTGGADQSQPPVSKHAGIFDQILTMLGGGPKKSYAVGPDGKMQVTETPPTRKQAMLSTIAGALTGLAAGAQVHGPGAALGSFGAGFDKTMGADQQRDAQGRQQAAQDAQRQQQMQQQKSEDQMRAAQTFETNQRAILTSRQAENAGLESRQKYIDSSNPVIEAARSSEANGVSVLKREHLTQQQLIQEHSTDGARHATTNVYLPDGETEVINPATGEPEIDKETGNPRMEYTYAELDPHAQVDLDSATLDEAVKNGYAVPGYTPGSGVTLSLPVSAAAQLVHYNQGIENFGSLVGQINSTLGLEGDKALDASTIIQANPQLGKAVSELASHWNGQPSTLESALSAMQTPGKDGKPNPQAAYARTISNAIGGDRLDEFNEQMKAKNKATEAAAEESAKEPYIEARENRNAARQDARDDKKTHAKDDELVIAGVPGSDDTQVVRKGDLPQGSVEYPLKDPQQLVATIRRTNDVQTKINALAQFVNGGGMDHIQPGLVSDAVAEVNNELKVGAFGAELPTARINGILNKENYNSMNKASRDFVRAYGFAREAMTQLPALQSFGKSNRMNETQLKAALQLLPDGRMNTKSAMDQMNALQDVFDPLRKLPTGLPGANLVPSFRDRQPQAQGGAAGAQPGAAPAAKPDAFAQFGGKARPPASVSAAPQ